MKIHLSYRFIRRHSQEGKKNSFGDFQREMLTSLLIKEYWGTFMSFAMQYPPESCFCFFSRVLKPDELVRGCSENPIFRFFHIFE